MAPRANRQHGVALLTAMVMLLAVLVLGAAAALAALDGEKSARSERERQVAMQAAEAALADAERDIEGGADPASARAALFAEGSALGFAPDCAIRRQGASVGLCQRVASPGLPAWQQVDLAGVSPAAGTVVDYGAFTGASMPLEAGATRPRYLIELVPYTRAGEDAGARAVNFYRITAIGFGARDSARVVLQTYYRKLERRKP
ncbi:MAG: pilus assembly protein [Pseudomonadota bacterium]